MRTDRTKVKQCLLNVLSNASKFTHNGKLTVGVERLETDRPMVQITISDTGIGMSEEQLGRLFQAFSQADASTTKKFGGTGLGLAITRHFCRLLGGDITVASRVGRRIDLHDRPSRSERLSRDQQRRQSSPLESRSEPIRRMQRVPPSPCWSLTTIRRRAIC